MSIKSASALRLILLLALFSVACMTSISGNDFNAFPSPKDDCFKKSRAFIDILHFNDISDVMKTPFFAYEYLKRSTPQTLRLFSGDVFFPSFLSTILKGKQFLHFLKKIKPDFSVIGNHELDYGEDNFMELKRALSIKWLAANFKRKGTAINVGEAEDHGLIELGGLKVCLFGLVDKSWMESLLIDVSGYELEDYLQKARTISQNLRSSGCDLIIALTHMSDDSDEALLRDTQSDIDLILGGHHHIYRISRFGQRLMIKSGENFDHFSHIKISSSQSPISNQSQNSSSDSNFDFVLRLSASEVLIERKQQFVFSLKRGDNEYFNVSVEKIPVNLRTGSRDLELYYYNQRTFSSFYDALNSPILKFNADIDVRSDTITWNETLIGHFLSDLLRASYGMDVGVVSMGAVRSENIFYKSDILREHDAHSMFSLPLDIKFTMLPGAFLKTLLDFSLQAYLGRVDNFETSGVAYNYNPTKPNPSEFIDATTMKIAGEAINPAKPYTLMLPNPTAAFKASYPILAAIPISDYNGLKITMIDVLKNFCFLPRDAENRTEFTLFKSQFPSITLDELNAISRSNAQPKTNPRLIQALIDSLGSSNVLHTLLPDALARLRMYTLASEIINVQSTFIFQISSNFQKRFNVVV